MKVTHIFWGLTYGGIETMLVNIMNEQAKKGVNVSVIIINDMIVPELLERISDSIEVVLINRKLSAFGFGFMKKINQALDRIKPDVIHLHRSEIRNFIDSHIVRKTCIVATVHNIPVGKIGVRWRWGSIIQRAFTRDNGNVCALNRVDNVFSISNSVGEALKIHYHIDSDTVPNGIMTSNFLNRDKGLNDNVFKIVQVSRLECEFKGQDLLIEAMAKLYNRINRRIEISFIGEGSSRQKLEHLVNEKGWDDRVKFLGSKTQNYISEHLKDYDLFVQPSRIEGFGLTVAEAMSANVPVLVSRGQGPSEITEGDKYGWTFENANVDDLAEKIEFIICNYSIALNKVEEARLHVKNRYDVSVTADNYISKYAELLRH